MTITAQFSIHYTQYLNRLGELTQELPNFAKDTQALIELYQWMSLTRYFDTKAIALQRTGQLGTYPSVLGQEAVGIGIAAAMQPDDILCPTYREPGAQLYRRVSMSELLAYWGGDERGNQYRDNSADFPICVPIATQCLHAAGVAAAIKYRQQNQVVVAVCGDGATSQGNFYEAMNVAGAWNLPLVFVVNNNQWAISVPRSAQTRTTTLAQKAIAGGFDGEQVDGNDVIAIQDRVAAAIEKARQGRGPSLIGAITYRLHDHTTADNASRYRATAEVEAAQAHEPLSRLRRYLNHQGCWSTEDEQNLQKSCHAQVERAVAEYLALTPEPATAMFDYMYATLPHELQEQRAELMSHLEQDTLFHG